MKRAVFSLLLIIALCGSVFAETSSENPPDYARMMVLNALLPGTAQRILGKLDEAKIFYASLPYHMTFLLNQLFQLHAI